MHAPATTSEPQPAWDIATLFPAQGHWSESQYMSLTAGTNRFVEFVDGYVEVLPVPTRSHQRIVLFLIDLLRGFLRANDIGGEVILGSYKIKLRERLIREPDLTYVAQEHMHWAQEQYATSADLVFEVVSPDRESHKRDWEEKREEYAKAGIPEYWIVDPRLKEIVVLKLAGPAYETHTEATDTGRVTSALLPGFEVDAAAVWAAAQKS